MNPFGSALHRFESVSSTNDIAREMALSGAGEGTVVIAAEQVSGRGRQGRSWTSPPGQGLYCSIILRPIVEPGRFAIATLAAAVAVTETLALDFAVLTDIKWPNDILLNGKKVCGILVESASEADHISFAILGIGVNLLQETFPTEIGQVATSVLLETGKMISPDELLSAMLVRLQRWYLAVLSTPDKVIGEWQELSSYAVNCPVRIFSAGSELAGVTRGLTANGGLLLETEDGQIIEVVSGEVSLRRA